MTSTDPNLGRRLAANTGAALLDLLLSKLTNTLVFIVLVRLLGTDDIAAIGVATGYIVLIVYLDASPVRILLRDYPRYRSDHDARNRLLTGLLVFWLAQAAAMFALAAAVAALLVQRQDLPGMGLLFLAMTCDYIALSLGAWIKTVFYSGLRQGSATLMNLVLSAVRLLAFGLLFWHPSLEAYSAILIGLAVAACAAWLAFFVVVFRYRPVVDRQSLASLWHCLTDYGAWDHLTSISMDTLLLVGTVVLSWTLSAARAPASNQQVADYSIALRFTSLLLLIPSQLQRALQIAIANSPERRRAVEAINLVIKFTALTAIAQLGVVWVAGEPLLRVLFRDSSNADVVLYTRLIAVAVTILAMALPLLSVISNLASLRAAFFQVFLPMAVAGVATYAAAAAIGGAQWLAAAQIAVYAGLALGLLLFTVRHCPFPLRWTWLSSREKAALQELLRSRS